LSTSASPARPGLSNVVDIVVSPDAAFARLREVPTWGWAFLAATVLGVIGSVLIGPAIAHAMDVSLPAQLAADPNLAKMPPEQQQRMIAMQLKISHVIAQLYFCFVPLILLVAALLQGVIMLIANAATKGDGSFRTFFALSMTVSVVGVGLSSLVLGVIVAIRGAGSFDAPSAVSASLPSLALLAPGARGVVGGFLGALNIFYLWATALLALGMTRVARIPAPAAWTTAIIMLLLTASLAAAGAARNG
jgi:Yip1 domain